MDDRGGTEAARAQDPASGEVGGGVVGVVTQHPAGEVVDDHPALANDGLREVVLVARQELEDQLGEVCVGLGGGVGGFEDQVAEALGRAVDLDAIDGGDGLGWVVGTQVRPGDEVTGEPDTRVAAEARIALGLAVAGEVAVRERLGEEGRRQDAGGLFEQTVEVAAEARIAAETLAALDPVEDLSEAELGLGPVCLASEVLHERERQE